MLVLTRKVNESIKIGDKIVITVVEIDRGKVMLGTEAPTEIPVHRQEVHDAIQRVNLTKPESPIEKKLGGSEGNNTPPKYYLIPRFEGNHYDVINMGKYGENIDYLI
jgi:carbon storage regulator